MYVQPIFKAFAIVFSHIGYVIATLFGGIVIFVTALLWTNFSLLKYTLLNESTSWQFTVLLAQELLLGTTDSVGWFMVGIIFLLSFLIAVTLAMTWFAWRNVHISGVWRNFFSSTGPGMVAALFGIGCAVCGSMLLAGILALFGAAGILLLLPFHGVELSVIAIGLLLYAVSTIAKVITAPRVC